jgi:hypothetical protein
LRKTKSTGVEYCDFDIQLDERGQAINGFSKVDGLGVEIDFFDFGIGSHHGGLAPEGVGSTASDQLSALNVGFMERWMIRRAQPRQQKNYFENSTLGLNLFMRGLKEVPAQGTQSIYQRISDAKYEKFENVTFMTIPDPIAGLFYSGNYLVL